MIIDVANHKCFTNHDLLQLLYQIKTRAECSGVLVELVPELSIGNGYSVAKYPENVKVGTKGIFDNLFPVRDKTLIMSLVSTYHEIRHGEQYLYLQHEDSNFGQQIAISYKSNAINCCYYTDNYFTNLREIDAERFGIRNAYNICVDYFGEAKANSLVCDYVNYKIKHNVGFILPCDGNKYSDILDIMVDFDNAYESAVNSKRKYDISRGLQMNDSLAKFLNEHSAYKELFFKETDGLKQDMQSAAIAIQYDGESDENISILKQLTLASVFNDTLESDRELPDIDYGITLNEEDDYDKE